MSGKETKQSSIRLLTLSGKTHVDGTRADPDLDVFSQSGLYSQGPRKLLVPPLGETSLVTLNEFATQSNILEQCIAAYETNVDGFGHRFDSLLGKDVDPPTEAQSELELLEEFFEYAYNDGSFVKLRRQTRRDMESCGIGYWEVVEGPDKKVVRLNHVPSHTVRMSVYDTDPVTVTELRRVRGQQKEVKVTKRFRTFCQITQGSTKRDAVWFKQFGDPRTMDSRTGEFTRGPAGRNLATAIIAFPVKYYAMSPYSVPRWIGNLPSVLGSRAAEEINLLYFDNKTLPPVIITVSGGTLTKRTIKQIEDVFEFQVKGRENFWRALVLEAAPAEPGRSGTTQAPRIEVKPLTNDQLKDAMFVEYDDVNRKKVRSGFRLAPIFTGETDDYTRATAENSRLVIEEQVFRPERVDFDYWVNRWLMPALGSRFWRFVSNGPNVTLNEDLIAAFTAAEGAGAMTPNIGRGILADVLEREVPAIDEEWGNQPFSLTLAQARASLGMPLPGTPSDGVPQSERQVDVEKMIRRFPAAIRVALLQELKTLIRTELNRRKSRGT